MNEPQRAIKVGDQIRIHGYPITNDSTSIDVIVTGIKESSRVKKGSRLKYNLTHGNDTFTTRLIDFNWEFRDIDDYPKRKKRMRRNSEDGDGGLKSPKQSKDSVKITPSLPSRSAGDTSLPMNALAPLCRHIVAPMVGGSELAFRLLCRRYGATLAYTPMMSSDKFAVDAKYREEEFQTVAEDRPLVAHFSANNPQKFLDAAKLVQDSCDAIDLNLGCPQRIAHSGHFGSYLLGDEDRDLVTEMVRTVSQGIRIPLFVKIRLLDSVLDTLRLVMQLIEAGAALVAIHARYRVNLVGRSGPGARDGAAHLDQVTTIRESVQVTHPHVPIIANGNVITWEDVVDNMALTGAAGIMSAEGLLDNPALFHKESRGKVDRLQLGGEYLDLARRHPVKLKSMIFHIRRICKDAFNKYQLMEQCVSSAGIDDLEKVLLEAKSFQSGAVSFEYDPLKEKKAKEAQERKKREEGKRKAYEERMVRKAKREKRPLDFYLGQGLEAPTYDEIQTLRAMLKTEQERGQAQGKGEVFGLWKAKFAQHCFAFHFDANGCSRERTCAFLHADSRAVSEEAIAYG